MSFHNDCVGTRADDIANRLMLSALRKTIAKLYSTADKLCNHHTARASDYRDAAKMLEWECEAIRDVMEGS